MTFSFTLLLQGVDALSDESADALFEAGCDDATFGARDGAQYAQFDREAICFGAAVSSAIRDVRRALPGLVVVRIEAKAADRSFPESTLCRNHKKGYSEKFPIHQLDD